MDKKYGLVEQSTDLILLLTKTDSLPEKEKLIIVSIDMRPHLNKSIFIKPIKTMINHSSTEIFFENLEVDEEFGWVH